MIRYVSPVLDRALTPTTYACRSGMGNHAAVRQAQRYLQRFPWYVGIVNTDEDCHCFAERLPRVPFRHLNGNFVRRGTRLKQKGQTGWDLMDFF